MLLEDSVSTSRQLSSEYFLIGSIQDDIIELILLSHVVKFYQFNPIKLDNMNVTIETNLYEPVFFSQDDTGSYLMPVFMNPG